MKKKFLFLMICAIFFCCNNMSCYNYISTCKGSSPYIKTSTNQTLCSKYEFILNFQGRTFNLTFDASKLNSDNYLINEQAKKYGRNGNHKEAVWTLQTLLNMHIAPEIAFEFLFPNINKKIDNILKQVDQQPKDSVLHFTPNFINKFHISQEKVGFVVDKNQLYLDLFNKFKYSPQVSTVLQRKKVLPNVTKQENIENTQLLSTYSTSIASSSFDRKSNVKLALKQFNGMIVKPNQEISFNKTTGRRTQDKGYKDAHIILDGLFVDGTGGGVCQSSTTLYNALLTCDNVEILEANRHSMPVSYVPLGFDAMVAYGSSDLRFKNNGETPIYIHTYSQNDRVYVELYGRKTSDNITKKRRSEVLKQIASKGDIVKNDTKNEFSDLMDENGYYRQKMSKDGFEVQTYLDYYKDGKLIDTQKVRHTTYPAQRGIVYKGKPKPKVQENDDAPLHYESMIE